MALKPVEKTVFGLLDKINIDTELTPAYKKQVVGETSLENIPKRFGRGSGFLIWLTNTLQKSEVGKLPKEYNPRVHGAYYPHRYYGTADPLQNVKLNEIPNWIARRNKSLPGIMRGFSRAYQTWNYRYLSARQPSMVPVYQFICGAMFYFFVFKYLTNQNDRHAKYHW